MDIHKQCFSDLFWFLSYSKHNAAELKGFTGKWGDDLSDSRIWTHTDTIWTQDQNQRSDKLYAIEGKKCFKSVEIMNEPNELYDFVFECATDNSLGFL